MTTKSYQRLLLSASVLLVTATGATLAHAQAVNTFPTPTAGSVPFDITAGPDGALWYAEQVGKIGRILPTGVTTSEFPTLTAGSEPTGITTGADGNLWFAEFGISKIGRITPNGVMTEFPTFTAGSAPEYITKGPDGNLWFTETATNKIGCMTPAGAYCNVGVNGEIATHTAASDPRGITVGADGNLWFAESNANKIGCITTAGAFCSIGTSGEVATATAASTPWGITAGPDGNLWFTERGGAVNKIGCITTAGAFCSIGTNGEVAVPTIGGTPLEITAGPNGALWFTELFGGKIGRITTAGVISEFSAGIAAGSEPLGITLGPGGNLWFTEQSAPGNIASFVLNNSHDYNGDGVSDILWYTTSEHAVGQWQMAPNPTLTAPLGQVLFAGGFFLNEPSQWTPIGQGEFLGNFAMANGTAAPGNGDADILWRDTLGNVGLWVMQSTQFLSGGVFGQVSTDWSVVGVGDLNGDGKADLVWQDTQGDVGVWLNTSTKFTATTLSFNPMTLGTLPTQWKVVGSDKYGDIFWQSCPNGNCVGGQVSMWQMNGFNITNIVNLGTTSNFSVAGTGDFDGNGSEDLLLSDGKGDVAIWLLSGTKVISAGAVTPPAGWPASNWSVAQTGDFNGDGFSDILFFDGSGNVGIWYMKGVNVVGFTTYPSAGNGWVPQGLNAD